MSRAPSVRRLPRIRAARALWTRLSLETLESRVVLSLGVGGAELPAYPGEWIAQFRYLAGAPEEQLAVIGEQVESLGAGLEVRSHLGADGLVLLAGPADLSYSVVVDLMSSLGTLDYVHPNFMLGPDSTFFDDPSFGQLYGLHNTGQTILGQVGIPDADIDAPEAWDIATGSGSVIVGVLDSGVAYTHPDLAANIYINVNELAGNGLDDDGNGFIDDVRGWDFFAGDNNPQDEHGHGTHVAGTIAAVGNNDVGVVGVAPGVKILPVRWLGPTNTGPMSAAIASINYVNMMRDRGHNIQITNNSWGGPTSAALEAAIAGQRDRGILFVAAAGNSNLNIDTFPAFPASLNFANIISVAASDNRDNKASFSNYGLNSVDLAAPGLAIFSTLPTSGATSGNPTGYGFFQGTSMATPHVTGVAALLWSLNPTATYQQVRDAILGSVDPINAFRVNGPTPVATGGRLNAFKALQQFGLAVVSTVPANGAVVSAAPTAFVVNLSRAYQLDSVDAADLTINGIPADHFDPTDADTITFTFDVSPVTAQGFQAMTLAAGAISPLGGGSPLLAYSGGFRYDLTPLQVFSASPAPSTVVPLPMTFLDLTFNEPLDPASVQATDLLLNRGTVTNAEVLPDTDNRTVRFFLSGLTTQGLLTATLAAGSLADAFGNPGPATAFAANYGLNATGVVFPVPLTALAPLGSLAYTGFTAGAIGSITEQDSYTLSVDGGQTITVVISPPAGGGGFSDFEEFGSGSASTLRATVRLTDPSGALVAFAEAPAAGSPAILQVGAAQVLGNYTITVGALSGADAYSVVVYLNAAVEAEAVGGPANNTRGTAQNVTPAFADLVAGDTAQRAAVRGQLTAAAGPTDDFFALDLAAGQPVDLALGLTNFTPTLSFSSTRTNLPVSPTQYPIFVGYRDLNGDGDLDMIAAINDRNTNLNGSIGVRLGLGGGAFGPFTLFPTSGGVFTRFLDFGDVNADGKLDVVATSDSSGHVSLFRGRGDGTFDPAVNTQVQVGALGLTVADLNGDGRDDAVVPHFGAGLGSISVLLAQANGTFAAPVSFSTGAPGSFGTDVGDLNGDGKLDVVTANFSNGNMSVLLGNGLGGFGAPTILAMGSGAWDVELADFNGDGKLDAVTGNQNAGNVAIRLGNGNGTFGAQAFFLTGGSGPRTVSVGDVNNDGKLDVIVPHLSSSTIGVLQGNGNGTFSPALVFSTGINPNAATLADVNGDGLLDLSSADAFSGSVSIRLNTMPNVRLELQDAAGNVVAVAAGAPTFPAGLSFTPAAGGTYYARVFGTATGVNYTLVATRGAAFEREPNDPAAAAQDISAAGGVLGAVASTTAATVVPNANATVEGNFNNSFPFNIGAFGIPSMRYQQIYARSQFTSAGIIDALRFRQDSGFGGSFTAVVDVKINLSYSARTPNNASNVFATNVGAGAVTVFDGLTTLSSAPASGGARPFDIVINVADLFNYDPSQGDLLVDIFVRNSPAFFVAFDAASFSFPNSLTTRIFQTDVNATTGQGPFANGLVTRFDMLRPAEDWYTVAAAAGQTLRLETFTPAGGPGEFVNTLDPQIELFDATGALVAVGVPKLDGRNERILYQATAAATYRVRVTGQNKTGGEYFLTANFAPIAVDDAAVTAEDTPVAIHALANDTSDTGLDPASLTVVSGPANGSVLISPLGVFEYTPNPNFAGVDAFTYTVRDALGLVSNVATVTVAVTAVADPPALSVGPTASGGENAAIPLTIAAALVDGDGSESLSLTIAGVPAGGVLSAGTDNGGGTWSLTPAQLAGLTLLLPDNLPNDAPFTLNVTATALEATSGSTASTTAPIEVTVRNVAPTAVFEAPAGGVEGSPIIVALTGAADVSPADTAAGFTYAFNFGSGYGAFGPAATASFVPPDNGAFTVRAKVRDKDGGETEYSATVIVDNADPVASLAGPSAGVRGQPLSFAGAFTDAGTADTHEVAWDFGDGTVLAFGPSTAAGALNPTHVFTDVGVYTVRLTVRDDDGGMDSKTHVVTISAVALQDDPHAPGTTGQETGSTMALGSAGATALAIGGTTADDAILVQPAGDDGSLEVWINGVSFGVYKPTGRVLVFGQAGIDDIQVAGSVAQPAWLYGGDGNDRLKGGAGRNVLLGGAGDDELIGGSARNLLIGGTGVDRIIGNSGEDLLIGGTTAWDANEAALAALIKEWTSPADYETRVARLRGTLSDGQNGAFVLNDDTVFDDLAADVLTGSSGRDWFFAFGGDIITGLHDDEELN